MNIKSFCRLTIVIFLIISCGEKQNTNHQETVPTFPIVKLKKRDVITFKSYPASIQGVVSSEIRPKTSGYIEEVLVDAGENVTKGQLMFRLETESLTQEAKAAKATVAVAKVEVDRLKPLVEKEIVSEVQLKTAEANLAQAKSNYSSITANIDYAMIKSPVNGVVGSIPFRIGVLASPTMQTPLTVVSRIDNVYAFISMNEKDFIALMNKVEGNTMSDKIKKIPPVSLVLADGSEYEHKGYIETISGNIDPQTGTVSLRAIFINPKGILRSGSSGTLRVPQEYKSVIIVPSKSTFEQQGRKFVYKVNETSTLSELAINSVDQTDRFYVVDKGVEQGDKILAEGTDKVKTGDKITPKETSLDTILNSFETVFK